ncbi:uncharacterized protein LOC141644118 [Silene latifolia]|uniref:uncharacterized protein LOC141644118 n=1 Tax=Silene latifolia TaxID=37657 RepID=UPI003D77B6A0
MKARYYPNSDFLAANVGNGPSYTWRGIVEARGVLDYGLRRRIGNGHDTLVWGQAWIPGTQTGKVIAPSVTGMEDLTVADLLIPGGGGWDRNLVDSVFLPFERERVLNIRVSSFASPDTWFWDKEKDGEYSVRSAYAALAGHSTSSTETSSWERERWLWNRLWKIPVWPRVKLFFWQLCSEAIATSDNIAARTKGEISPCYFCSSVNESCLHLFRNCSVAAWVWEGLGLNCAEEGEGGGLREWIEACWGNFSMDDCGKFMLGCWAIWECRNKCVFEGTRVEPERIIKRVRDVMVEMGEAEVDSRRRRARERREVANEESEGWQPARGEYVKLNVDAGVKEGEGVGTGAVCRDGQGNILWGVSVAREVTWDPGIAEAVAVLDGLQEALAKGHQHVMLESDLFTSYRNL